MLAREFVGLLANRVRQYESSQFDRSHSFDLLEKYASIALFTQNNLAVEALQCSSLRTIRSEIDGDSSVENQLMMHCIRFYLGGKIADVAFLARDEIEL